MHSLKVTYNNFINLDHSPLYLGNLVMVNWLKNNNDYSLLDKIQTSRNEKSRRVEINKGNDWFNY